MSFYETPRRNASDSTTSTRSMNRGHRREHSDPCPLPSPGLPHKAPRDEGAEALARDRRGEEHDDAEEPRDRPHAVHVLRDQGRYI